MNSHSAKANKADNCLSFKLVILAVAAFYVVSSH